MQNKLNDISVIRVVAMLLVVYYHIICPYSMWRAPEGAGFYLPEYVGIATALRNIHMPIFFLIAGYLFGYKRIRGGYAEARGFLLGKAGRVLVPYATVGLLIIALRQGNLGQYFRGNMDHLWFLVTIFECYAVGKLIDFVLWEKSRTKTGVFVAAVMVMMLQRMFALPLDGNFIDGFFFYLAGMLVASLNIDSLKKHRKTFVWLAAAALALVVAAALYGSMYMPAGAVFVLLGFIPLRTAQVGSLPRWMHSLDKCSMGIYIVHHIVIKGMNRVDILHHIMQTHYYIYPTAQFVFVVALSWAVTWWLRHYRFSRYVGL